MWDTEKGGNDHEIEEPDTPEDGDELDTPSEGDFIDEPETPSDDEGYR
jgi:hypothetical protein